MSSRRLRERQRTRAAVLAFIMLLDTGLPGPAVFAQSGLGWVDPPPVNPWVDPPPLQSTEGQSASQPPQSVPQPTPEIPAPAATMAATPRATEPVPQPTPEIPAPAARMAATEAVRAISRPSFNCRSAKTAVERTICADPMLAAKDGRMALLYEQAGGSRYRPVDPAQWSWLAARNRCGRVRGPALKSCIHRAYDARIAELSAQ
jgi:hypothetical protein